MSNYIKNLSLSDINNLLYNNKEYVINNNLNYFLSKDDITINSIIVYYLSNYDDNKDIIYKISRHKNLHIRYLFMTLLIKYYNDLMSIIYSDITKYLKTKDNLMDVEEVCELAILIYNKDNINIYNKFKDFILKNYKYNYLASKLICIDDNNKELIDNIEDYYYSSIDRKMFIFKYYKKYLPKEIIKYMNNIVKYFNKPDYDYRPIDRIYECGFGEKLEELLFKYLLLSKNKTYELIGKGSTTYSYRIGDYVFKLSSKKWSYEDVICPNNYLIIKNYEEIFLRNENNEVYSGIEVQKFLKKDTNNLNSRYFTKYSDELRKLGYYVKDRLDNGNIRILDSYLDADTNNHENLPDWFKDLPIVLVDRDLVYSVDNCNPKSLYLKQ